MATSSTNNRRSTSSTRKAARPSGALEHKGNPAGAAPGSRRGPKQPKQDSPAQQEPAAQAAAAGPEANSGPAPAAPAKSPRRGGSRSAAASGAGAQTDAEADAAPDSASTTAKAPARPEAASARSSRPRSSRRQSPAAGRGARTSSATPEVLVPETVADGKKVSLLLHPADERMLKEKRLDDGADGNSRIRAMMACVRADPALAAKVDALAVEASAMQRRRR